MLNLAKNQNWKFSLVEFSQSNILYNMTDTYSQFQDELSILYPGVTDIELNEMTSNLIEFFITAVTSVLKNQEKTKEFVIDDKNYSVQPGLQCK